MATAISAEMDTVLRVVEPGDGTAAERIPADIRAMLYPDQIDRLGALLTPPPAEHGIDYRVSTSVFGQRFYLAVITGPELRTPHRLARDGQHRSLRWFLFEAGLIYSAISGVAVTALLFAVVAAYLLKSGLGINLFDDPSFLHRYFFD